jgi:hypothetical protein
MVVDIVNKARFFPVSVVYICLVFSADKEELDASKYLQLFVVGIP